MPCSDLALGWVNWLYLKRPREDLGSLPAPAARVGICGCRAPARRVRGNFRDACLGRYLLRFAGSGGPAQIPASASNPLRPWDVASGPDAVPHRPTGNHHDSAGPRLPPAMWPSTSAPRALLVEKHELGLRSRIRRNPAQGDPRPAKCERGDHNRRGSGKAPTPLTGMRLHRLSASLSQATLT